MGILVCACSRNSKRCQPARSKGWCKTWTLDSGLDSWTGLWTDIWTGFWTDTAMGDDHFQPLTSAEAKPKSVMSVAETNLELRETCDSKS